MAWRREVVSSFPTTSERRVGRYFSTHGSSRGADFLEEEEEGGAGGETEDEGIGKTSVDIVMSDAVM